MPLELDDPLFHTMLKINQGGHHLFGSVGIWVLVMRCSHHWVRCDSVCRRGLVIVFLLLVATMKNDVAVCVVLLCNIYFCMVNVRNRGFDCVR